MVIAILFAGRLAICVGFLALVLVMHRAEGASEVEENRVRKWVGMRPVGPVGRWLGRAVLAAIAVGAVWQLIFPP